MSLTDSAKRNGALGTCPALRFRYDSPTAVLSMNGREAGFASAPWDRSGKRLKPTTTIGRLRLNAQRRQAESDDKGARIKICEPGREHAFRRRAPELSAAVSNEWLRSKDLLPHDERVQGDAYLACTALRSAMRDSEGHPGRDYMVEKLEENIERWRVHGVYPRLTLGPGQRFASKSGYVVRFDAESDRLLPVGERSAP
jgi:hypothetical protein